MSDDIKERVGTLEDKVEAIVDKVDRIDENVVHLSNGGLKAKLQEQNEMLTEQLGTVVSDLLNNQKQIDMAELENDKINTQSKYNFMNNKIMFSFYGAAIFKFLDLVPDIIQYFS